MTQRKLKLKLSEEVTWYKFSASFYLLNINVVQVSALLHDTNIYLIQYPYLLYFPKSKFCGKYLRHFIIQG